MRGLEKIASKFTFGKKQDASFSHPTDDYPSKKSELKRTNAKLRKRKSTLMNFNGLNPDPGASPNHGQRHFPRRFMGSFVPAEDSSKVNPFGPDQQVDSFDEETREVARLKREIRDKRISAALAQPPLPEQDGSMASRLGLKVNTLNTAAIPNLQDYIGAEGSAGIQRLQQAVQATKSVRNDDDVVSAEAQGSKDSASAVEQERSAVSELRAIVATCFADLDDDVPSLQAMRGSQVNESGNRGKLDATDVDLLSLKAAGLALHNKMELGPDYHCPLGLQVQHQEDQTVRHGRAALRRKPLPKSTQAYEKEPGRRISWETIVPSVSAPSTPNMTASSSFNPILPVISSLDWSKLKDGAAKNVAEAYDAANTQTTIARGLLFFESQRNSGSSGTSPTDSFMSALTDVPPSKYEGKGKARVFDQSPAQVERESEEYRRLAERKLIDAETDFMRAKVEAAEIAIKSSRAAAESHRYDAERNFTVARKASGMLMAQSATLMQKSRDMQQALLLQKQQEEAALLAAERARRRDCNVCGDAKSPLDFAAKPPTSKCEHLPTTCNDCLAQWMTSEFESKGGEGIKCPECPQKLDYSDVQRAASTQTFEAYDNLLTRLALGACDDFAWCLAPSCGSGQLNPENRNYMDCKHCGYKQCLRHKVQWHADETCEEYEYRVSGDRAREEEAKTEAMLDEMSKKCPGANCGWRIQKIDGCEHMTCKKCRWEFCWQCLASQKEIKSIGNTAHATTCKFHSTNLDVAWPFNVH
ncbi:hypothetical protein LTR35_003211 [Friedmanniomyces endolithicus]|uniref:RBR-type E3 ubiquitin transferase n=1 Tax=Friedmanniomyces endolithicus TaxID=329885 RepID=A0AAN6FMK1_9PEZI|nr:hypothetical protein LTR35_003211 [Friedmanniomyces endolithicus]KAK0293068.1 hypothetical protein LTS00_007669 [Friedmanniomyces endolithicus]KAK0316450.1 hypothetical protein LTR01_000198 [Friedmanniomyces endolithicus]KAK0319403.1 hypothetical protein LTR82_009468 [Friedmanniomyces endolithicus]